MGTAIYNLLSQYGLNVSLFSARAFLARQLPNFDNIKNAHLIIEATSENHNQKIELLKSLAQVNRDGTIATTTSSLSISELSSSIDDPSRFCGVHFMNPANKISVIEFTQTANFAVNRKKEMHEFLRSIDRLVFETEDFPGFVLNALLFPFLNRAIYLVEASKMSPKDVDEIMRQVCGHKLGPLATIDLIGLDVCLEITKILHKREPAFNLPPAELLINLVQEKRLGKKVGAGFYDY